MSQVNVLLAMKDSHYQMLLDNFRFNPDGSRVREDLTISQARKLRYHVVGHWRTPLIAGNIYHVLSWTIPLIYQVQNDPSSGLKWVEFLKDKWPNVFIVLGAWLRDGLQLGTVYDEGIITGTPIYPVHSQILKVMPDVAGLPATEPSDVNLIFGWSPRIWV